MYFGYNFVVYAARILLKEVLRCVQMVNFWPGNFLISLVLGVIGGCLIT